MEPELQELGGGRDGSKLPTAVLQGGGQIAGPSFSLYKGFRMVSWEGPWPFQLEGADKEGPTVAFWRQHPKVRRGSK